MLGSSLHSALVFLVTARGLGEGDQFSAEIIVNMYYPHRYVAGAHDWLVHATDTAI